MITRIALPAARFENLRCLLRGYILSSSGSCGLNDAEEGEQTSKRKTNREARVGHLFSALTPLLRLQTRLTAPNIYLALLNDAAKRRKNTR